MGDKIMKKSISAIMSLVMTAALFTQGMPITAGTVDTPVYIDKGIYDQLIDYDWINKSGYDINSDGVISEEEFEKIEIISINLDEVNDISGLEKAEGLRIIGLYGGSITDFSVLSGLKNLKSVSISSNPISDVSYFKSMNLEYLGLEDTNVNIVDRINLLQQKEFEVPVGFYGDVSLKPSGMLPNAQMIIEDSAIAGFGTDGRDYTYCNQNDYLIAKKAGETTYSLQYSGVEIAKGKIKVVPSEIINPQTASDVTKVRSIQTFYSNGELTPYILTEDGEYYYFKDGKYYLFDNDVKKAYAEYIDLTVENTKFILKNDGSFTINGKSVFGEDIKVLDIIDHYAITDDGSLWFLTIKFGNRIEKYKIYSNCEEFVNERIVKQKDGTNILVYCDTVRDEFDKEYIFEIGDMNIVSVYGKDYMVIDDQGNLWDLNVNSNFYAPYPKIIAQNVVKVGTIYQNGSSDKIVYADTDGNLHYCDSNYDVGHYTVDDIVASDGYFTVYNSGPFDQIRNYTFKEGATVDGVKISRYNDVHGYGLLSNNQTLHLNCIGRYMAVSDVKDSFGTVYDTEANDLSVLIQRTDYTLWEYRIGAGTITPVTDEILKSEKREDNLKMSDVISITTYMTGIGNLKDSQLKQYDMNADGKINSLDVILMKNMLL